MKKIMVLILATVMLLGIAGCAKAEEKIDALEEKVEQQVNNAANALLNTDPASGGFTPVDPSQLLTPDKAQEIALAHAGVAAEDVVGLHTIMQIDNGRQEYEVTFRVGHLEYEYEIDAATGTILSTETDD